MNEFDLVEARSIDGFWYLGTPYSKFPGGIAEGFRAACRTAAALIALRVPLFSPIAHSHPIAIHGALDPYDHALWLPADVPLMNAAHGLIVAGLPSWEASVGLAVEIQHFTDAGKPVVYLDPEKLGRS